MKETNYIKNVLILSIYFPPEAGGTSTVYENLLKHFDQDKVFVISGYPYFRTSGSKLTCKVYRFIPVLLARIPLGNYIMFAFIPLIVLMGLIVSKKYKIDTILATYPDSSFLVSSYLLHKLIDAELYVYLHDTFVERQRNLLSIYIAKFFQNRIFNNARKIFVISEGMSDFYRERYNLHTILIPHCLSQNIETFLSKEKNSKDWGGNRIVFTGAIYEMNIDAIRLMVKTVDTLTDTKLCISTFNPKALKRLGINSNNVEASFHPEAEHLIEFQKKSDILYLPLAFESPWPDEMISVFPTKTIEYLVSGVPILVHAPSHHFLTRFARQEGFALVVDQYDINALKKGILLLLRDNILRQVLVEKAFVTAQKFDGEKIAEHMNKHLFENQY